MSEPEATASTNADSDKREAPTTSLSDADSHSMVAALLDTLNAIIVALDEDGCIVEFGQGAQQVTGYTRAEVEGRNWFELICPPDRYPKVWDEFHRLREGGLPRTFENPILTKSGEERFILWGNSEWLTSDGAARTISVGIDVTEHRRSDRALDEALSLLTSIVEGAPSAIFAKDLKGRYTLMNKMAAGFLGHPQVDILGCTDAELFPPDLAQTYVDGDRRVIETGTTYSYNEESTPAPDGSWQYRLVTKGPVLDSSGDLAGVFGITSDLTAPIFAEKAIAKAARENDQLARAAMALIGCRTSDDVFDVIVSFFAEAVPGSLVIVNESVDDGQFFRTRHITGADESLLRKAGRSIGFDLIGKKYPVTREYRENFFTATLTKVQGGFGRLSASELPKALIPVIQATFNLHDAYTIGIRGDGSEYGSVHIVTRVPNAEVPVGIIDAFMRQCVLALAAIERAEEVAAYQERLEGLVAEREQHSVKLAFALSSVIDVVSRTVEMRDPYTAGHQRRVAVLAERLARECGMAEVEIEDIRIAALMHDVGKVSVPAEILAKPGKLTAPEFALVKNHALAGYEIVQAAHMREPVAEIIYQHHERCDGSGYPRGLHADELHPGAKVIMVADVVEAMASHRPYRAIVGIPQAREEITGGAGVTYDADVVAACIAVLDAGFEFDPQEI